MSYEDSSKWESRKWGGIEANVVNFEEFHGLKVLKTNKKCNWLNEDEWF